MKNEKSTHNKLVVVRHAHRETSDRHLDNGLSKKGLEQVEEIVDLYRKSDLPQGHGFYSSPKLRCQQTLRPICEVENKRLHIESMLDEQGPHESQSQYLTRIQNLAQFLNTLEGCNYICSHGDVIPDLINDLSGIPVDLKKGRFLVLVREGTKWRMA